MDSILFIVVDTEWRDG